MADEKTRSGHCPECGPDRLGEVVAEFRETFDEEEHGTWGRTDYRIVKCRGCDFVYYQVTSVFSEDVGYRQNAITGDYEPYLLEQVIHWPIPIKRKKPEWAENLHVDYDQLNSLLDDVYGALNADLRTPAAIAARTTFDAASGLLGVDPAGTFAEKLDALRSKGYIGSSEHSSLSVLIDAGGAAAHRGWKPKAAQLDTITSILETFLHRTFVLRVEADNLKQSLPSKPVRQ